MANKTAWIAGNGAGLVWTSAFAAGDLTSLADSKTILSSAAAIANGTALDIYADLSVEVAVTSSTPRAGAYLSVYLFPLLEDGTTYGDGLFSGGSASSNIPPFAPVGVIPLQNTAMTLMAGLVQGIILPPGNFNWALFNFSGVTFSATAANNVAKFRTYNLNLNS